MRTQQYPLLFLATILLLALKCQVSIAFTLRFKPGAFVDREATYFVQQGNILFEGAVQMAEPYVLTQNEKEEFYKKLKDDFSDWIFDIESTSNNLTGSFEISLYDADIRPNGSIGGQIVLDYNLGTGDPTPTKSQLHWIQRVKNNHSITTNRHGDDEDTIDVASGQKNPFYDLIPGFPYMGGTTFFDGSYRPDYQNEHYWLAELYLAEVKDPKNKPKEVTVYNGISWGWRNALTPVQPTKTFVGTLNSGYQIDNFSLEGLTPGNYFYAWTNNDIPSNRCNPNTYLNAYSGSWYNSDNDSSFIGDGYASALSGIVSDDGTINFKVNAANGGRRGEDRGSYELNVKVYEGETAPQTIIAGSSGGGGVIFERPRPGNTQQNPILPTTTAGGWQIFNNVPSCRWYDPPHNYGFEFQALENTLFTEILDFPVGLDNRFTVSVGNNILGEFSPGDSLDFVSLLGYGVPNFKITGIEAFIGSTPETAFPIQLAFNNKVGSFQMRPLPEPETPTPQQVPEPGSALGLLVLGAFGGLQKLRSRNSK